jgi:hypothetical protein
MIPVSLYEKLPLVYAVAAIVAIVLLGAGPLVIASALLLFAAAVLTYVQRRTHRARILARARPRNSTQSGRGRSAC